MEAKQTPLIELLEQVPHDARVVVEHDQFSSSSHPVGRLCHEAAAALRARLAQPEKKTCLVSNESCKHGSWCSEVYCQEHCKFIEQSAQPEQEPVAWANESDLPNFDMKVRTGPDLHHTVPLYTAPPKREWVGLTDEEVSEIIDREIGFNSCWGPEEKFARAIEQALKEKNT